MRAAESGKTSEFIKTYVRIKPITMDEISLVESTKQEVTVAKYNHEQFEYNEVFGETCKNSHIFQTVMLPVVSHIFEGYNACILAYGQTASGKTYTMKGVEINLGLIPLTIREIFRRINQQSMVAKVRISYFEIYNENIIDLLSNDVPPRYLDIRDDQKKNATIQDLIEAEVTNVDDSLTCYDQGEARRKFASNNINFGSSRSHTIFKISMEVATQDLTTSLSTISLVDLAGSESISKTHAVGILKKESENINKSLLALSNVIRSLSQKSSYINFRDSRLTRILQPCLTGHAKTVVICTITQNQQSVGETLNTLKFGVAANSIKIAAQKNLINTQSNPLPDSDPRYEQLCDLLNQQRAQKQLLKNDIVRLHSQIARYKDFQTSTLNQTNDLKYKLLLEQNQNINNNILLKQIKGHREQQDQRSGNNFSQLEEDVKLYKSQISRLEIVVSELKENSQNCRKLNDQLERNERTLLDRLAKYERELSDLQQSMNTHQSEMEQEGAASRQSLRSRKTRISEPQSQKQRKLDFSNKGSVNNPRPPAISENPYTLGKVIQLSTRILDMKIQLNEYMKANTELQEEIERLSAKLGLMEKNYVPGPAEEEQQVSQKTKTSRQSGGVKHNEWQIRSIKEESKRLKHDKVVLMKKLTQMRTILKKNASNHIEELHGFNKFIDKNFTENQKEHFQFLFDEDPKDYEVRGGTSSKGSRIDNSDEMQKR